MGKKTTIRILAVAMLAAFTAGPVISARAADENGTGEAVSADRLIADRAPQEEKKEDAQKLAEKAAQEQTRQDPSTLAKRLELAQKMHEIRPTRDQVDSAIRRAAESVPPQDKEAFIAAMSSVLNYKAIERISIDAMAEVYTIAELQAMVEYYSKPEARSATAKIRDWAAIVQPEINRIIDKAMMRVRTGAPN